MALLAWQTKTVKKTVNDWELINDAKALWTRNPSDITDEEYKSFYQSLTKDFGVSVYGAPARP